MNIFLFFLILLSFGSIKAGAQNRYLDSLKEELSKKQPDSTRIKTLLELGNRGAYNNAAQSLEFLREAEELAQKTNDVKLLGEAFTYTGTVYFYTDNYDSALYYFNKGIAAFTKDSSLDSRISISILQANIADVMVQQGKYEEAVKIYLESIDIIRRYQPEHYNAIGNTLLAIGEVYKDMGQYKKSLSYIEKAVNELKKDKNNPTALAFGQLFAVSNLIFLSEYDEAEKYLNSTREIAGEVNSNSLYTQLYGNWGALYSKKGELEKSAQSYIKALQYAVAAEDKHSEISALIQLGFLNLDAKLKQYADADRFLKRALILITEQGDKYREARVLRGIAKAETGMRNYDSAVVYYDRYIVLNDSLNDADIKRKINEIENEYQAEKKQLAIDALQKDNQLQKLEIDRKSTLNIALVIGFLLLLLVASLFYKNFINKNRLLKQQETLHKQRIKELEKERKIVAMQSVLKGQEEERSRLARDLHDGVGGLLSGVKLSMSGMKGNVYLSEANAYAFNNIIDQLDHSITELRRVSHNMMPEALIKFGLAEAIENYCDNLNATGVLRVQFQAYGMQNRMEQSCEIIVYRIIQELLNNVIKHAAAKNVLIQLSREDNRFSLTVEDDGKGMERSEKGDGAGLANIKARAEYLNGSVDIVSNKGEGTSVHVEGNCS